MEKLPKDELKLIIESLLFTGSVQVFAEHTDEQCKKMITLAKKLNENQDVDLTNIYFLEEKDYEENYASDILKGFPKVPRVGIKDMLK